MTSYISAELRRLVESRAKGICEYCLIHANDTFLGTQVDHIISEKHGGLTEINNLAIACTTCNRAKGSDIGSIAASTGEFSRLFNPRINRWTEHFRLSGVRIESLTPIGEATSRVLNFNSAERLLEREAMRLVGRFPSPQAAEILK